MLKLYTIEPYENNESGKKSHVSRKLHMIYISSNNYRHTVTKYFTPLHYTSANYTSITNQLV